MHLRYISLQNNVGLKEQWESFKKRSLDDQNARPQIEARHAQINQPLLSDGSPEELERLRHTMLTTDVYNQFYFLFTASPIFDPKTGKGQCLRAKTKRSSLIQYQLIVNKR